MPRLNVGRSVEVEANLRRRIAYERERRSQSYETLAELMTDAGCAISGSSLYKIEKGGPPRRVSVDELVTLAQIWGFTLDELLTPVELVEQHRAHELVEAIQGQQRHLSTLTMEAFEKYVALFDLAHEDQELYEYVIRHLDSANESEMRLKLQAEEELPALSTIIRLGKATSDFWRLQREAAVAWTSYKRGDWTAEDRAAAQKVLDSIRLELVSRDDVRYSEGSE